MPTRLALQSGQLDDRRRHITADDELWERACACFVGRDEIEGDHHDELRALCERWPTSAGSASHREALAVAVALAAPFAARERILQALNGDSALPHADVGDGGGHAPILVSPWAVARPQFPHLYDPDSEEPAPIIAVLDGPRSSKVGELLDTIKARDEALADAIVLGADLETLESLDRMRLEATRAARWKLAAKVEQDKERWKLRAEQARARQRLEGSHYGWRSDNFPPGCLEAVRAALRHDVDVLLHHAPPPTSG